MDRSWFGEKTTGFKEESGDTAVMGVELNECETPANCPLHVGNEDTMLDWFYARVHLKVFFKLELINRFVWLLSSSWRGEIKSSSEKYFDLHTLFRQFVSKVHYLVFAFWYRSFVLGLTAKLWRVMLQVKSDLIIYQL